MDNFARQSSSWPHHSWFFVLVLAGLPFHLVFVQLQGMIVRHYQMCLGKNCISHGKIIITDHQNTHMYQLSLLKLWHLSGSQELNDCPLPHHGYSYVLQVYLCLWMMVKLHFWVALKIQCVNFCISFLCSKTFLLVEVSARTTLDHNDFMGRNRTSLDTCSTATNSRTICCPFWFKI